MDASNREGLAALGEKPQVQRSGAHSQHAVPPDQVLGPLANSTTLTEGRSIPLAPTENSEAQTASEQRTKELLAAYQRTLDVAGELPALVWVPWGDKGLGRYVRVPYFRWFLRYFLTHHISKSLNILNRRLHAAAALANDPDTNKASRDIVKLYLQSLSPPPYSQLIFVLIIAAVLAVVPLQAFGNALDVLPLVAAFLRVDLTYVARAFTGTELGTTIRATILLMLGLSVVGSMMTSPFSLKRLLFNLYPLSVERIAATAARGQASRVDGVYVLEEQVFGEIGLRRPKEGMWDLYFLTLAVTLLLLFSLCLGLVALDFATSWDFVIDIPSGSAATINVSLREVHWLFYALPASILLVVGVMLFKRMVTAWQKRKDL